MAEKSATSFLDRQINTYGLPSSNLKQTHQTAIPQQQTTAFMPNGAPIPQPAPQPVQQVVQQPTGSVGSVGTVSSKGVYSGGQAPTMTYQQQYIPQFQAPNTGQIGEQTQSLMSQFMSNPYSLSPQTVAQMKGTARDQAALLEKQTMGNMMGALGARGIDPNSKYGLAQQRALQAGTNRDILNSNRALDIQAALQNRNDMMQAINLGNQYEDSVFGRAAQAYGLGLQGLGMQGQEQQRFLDSIARNYQLGLQGAQLGSSSQLSAVGNDLTRRGQDLQNSQFGQNLDFNYEQLRQQMANASAGRSQANDHFNQQMAFQYQQAQQQEFNNLLQYLMSGGV